MRVAECFKHAAGRSPVKPVVMRIEESKERVLESCRPESLPEMYCPGVSEMISQNIFQFEPACVNTEGDWHNVGSSDRRNGWHRSTMTRSGRPA